MNKQLTFYNWHKMDELPVNRTPLIFKVSGFRDGVGFQIGYYETSNFFDDAGDFFTYEDERASYKSKNIEGWAYLSDNIIIDFDINAVRTF